MFQANFLSRIKRIVKKIAQPSTKQEYLDKWNKELEMGKHLEFVTNTDGYRVAAEHFEVVVNALLREGGKLEQVQGIEQVFQYFESGKAMAENAQKQIESFGELPE